MILWTHGTYMDHALERFQNVNAIPLGWSLVAALSWGRWTFFWQIRVRVLTEGLETNPRGGQPQERRCVAFQALQVWSNEPGQHFRLFCCGFRSPPSPGREALPRVPGSCWVTAINPARMSPTLRSWEYDWPSLILEAPGFWNFNFSEFLVRGAFWNCPSTT